MGGCPAKDRDVPNLWSRKGSRVRITRSKSAKTIRPSRSGRRNHFSPSCFAFLGERKRSRKGAKIRSSETTGHISPTSGFTRTCRTELSKKWPEDSRRPRRFCPKSRRSTDNGRIWTFTARPVVDQLTRQALNVQLKLTTWSSCLQKSVLCSLIYYHNL